MPDDDVGIHEAGHCVIAVLVNGPIAYATVHGKAHMRYQKQAEPPPTTENVARELAVSLAGEIAEVIYGQMADARDIVGDRGLKTETVDFRNALKYAQMISDETGESPDSIIDRVSISTCNALLDSWPAVVATADALRRDALGTLSGDEIRAIVGRFPDLSTPVSFLHPTTA